jgi:hypothetical protein
MTQAVIVYAQSDRLPRAYAWCAAKGWPIKYAVPADRWRDALRLALEEDLIVVAASPAALPPDRIPRVEVVEDVESAEPYHGHGASQ